MNPPLVSVIIPIYNNHNNLKVFLESFLFSSYKNFEIIVNDDLRSSDESEKLCNEYKKGGLNIKYIKKNKSMAQGRKSAVDFSSGEILLHLDSDMKVSKNLLKECVALVNKGFDALVIPEESFGSTFWAKCKQLEKRCYKGVEQIESARCFKTDIYRKIGGHDERMVFSEDKDLDIRIRISMYKIGRTKNYLYHNEGNLELLKMLNKKFIYAKTAKIYQKKHPKEFLWQINPINRYIMFLKNINYLFKSPIIYIGMLFMKTCEFGASYLGMVLRKRDIDKKIEETILIKYPFVSFIIPTFNAERYLKLCLDSIFMQNYPKNKIEVLIIDGGSTDKTIKIAKQYKITILSNPKRIAEYGKSIGIKKSNGDYFILMDSDNEIVERDWLVKMVYPILENKNLFGVESPLSFDDKLSSLNRYFARMRIADPLAKYLASKPKKIINKEGYSILKFDKNATLITGANGFLWNKQMVFEIGGWDEKFEEANYATYIHSKNDSTFAISEDASIRHYYCENITDYIKKREKVADKMITRIKNKEKNIWIFKLNKIRIFFISFYLCSFIGPLLEGIYRSIRELTYVYLVHPVISILTMYIYAKKTYKLIF